MGILVYYNSINNLEQKNKRNLDNCYFFFAVTFELAQKYKVILGTGDIYDVFTYFSVFLITLFLNNFLTNKPQSINENT